MTSPTLTAELPLYRQIADTLRGQIQDGRLRAGARLPSEKHIQAAFGGVSRDTVRKATAMLLEEGLVERLGERGLSIRPASAAAESPAVSDTARAAVSDVQVFTNFAPGTARENFAQTGFIQSMLAKVGHLTLTAAPAEQRFADFAAANPGRVARHVIFSNGYAPSAEDEAALRRVGALGVVVGRAREGCSLPQINGNHAQGAYLLTQHLVTRGHRHIGVMTGPAGNVAEDWVLEGYGRVMADLGVAADPRRIIRADGPFTADGRRAAREMLRRVREDGVDMTALLVVSQWLAAGAMEELRAAGVAVPASLAVAVYFHRRGTDELCHFPMTGVTEDNAALVDGALSALARLERGEFVPTDQTVSNVALVVRRSCGGYAG